MKPAYLNFSLISLLFSLCLITLDKSPASAAVEGNKLFKYTCGSCHLIGKGKMVGPDLVNVSERHSKEWIVNFIRSSQTMIKDGDEKAVTLFKQYNSSVMPDHLALQTEEIDAIIAYIDKQSSILKARKDQKVDKTDRSEIPKARSINVESISINDPIFKLIYWITAFVALAAVFTIAWYIARLSQ